jgi:hypothetical protein
LAVTDVLYKTVRADEGENESDNDETSDNDSDKDSEDGDDCHNNEILYKNKRGIFDDIIKARPKIFEKTSHLH